MFVISTFQLFEVFERLVTCVTPELLSVDVVSKNLSLSLLFSDQMLTCLVKKKK